MITLYEYGKSKRTSIAMHANMGYDNCVQYLNCLEMLEFVKQEQTEDNFAIFSLTEQGLRIFKKILRKKVVPNTKNFNEFNTQQTLV